MGGLPTQQADLLHTYYHPHHAQLERAVAGALARHGRCLVVDCHSFPSSPLPYERGPDAHVRPDICIGTDAFHTSEATARAFVQAFAANGWTVELNRPFAGALVPASGYRQGRDGGGEPPPLPARSQRHPPPGFRRRGRAGPRVLGESGGGGGVGGDGRMGLSLASRLPVGASLLATLHYP